MKRSDVPDDYVPQHVACKVLGFRTDAQLRYFLEKHTKSIRCLTKGQRRWVHAADLVAALVDDDPREPPKPAPVKKTLKPAPQNESAALSAAREKINRLGTEVAQLAVMCDSGEERRENLIDENYQLKDCVRRQIQEIRKLESRSN